MNPERNNPDHDHEHSDWNLKIVTWGAAILVITVAILCSGAWWIFREFRSNAAARIMGTVRGNENIPPSPRLEVSPTAELTATRNREQEILDTYGWIDRSQGIVRIPIEHAMQLMVQHGFPTGEEGGK